MKEIVSSNGKVIFVDDNDFDLMNRWRWYAHLSGGCYYAYRSIRVRGRRGVISMHRQLMGSPQGLVVDHIDGNGLNNQKSNLRVCTKKENLWHHNKIKGIIPYLGVTYKRKKFLARITCDKRVYRLGAYYTPEEAARAYDKMAKVLFGQFATLNFPHEG